MHMRRELKPDKPAQDFNYPADTSADDEQLMVWLPCERCVCSTVAYLISPSLARQEPTVVEFSLELHGQRLARAEQRSPTLTRCQVGDLSCMGNEQRARVTDARADNAAAIDVGENGCCLTARSTRRQLIIEAAQDLEPVCGAGIDCPCLQLLEKSSGQRESEIHEACTPLPHAFSRRCPQQRPSGGCGQRRPRSSVRMQYNSQCATRRRCPSCKRPALLRA